MKVELIKTNVSNLVPGMFVSKLDRPWLETPFHLQGFPIRNRSDIDVIKEYCSFVYIDTIKSTPIDNKDNTVIKKAPAVLKNELVKAVNSVASKQYENKVSFIDELPKANKTYYESENIVSQVMIELKKSGKLKVSDLKASVKPIVESVLNNRDAMTWLCTIKKKDDYLYRHSISSCIWALLLGRHLGFDENRLNLLGLGAMLLDIGKTKIPEDILNKTGKLNDEEEKLMRKHVTYGLQILDQSKGINNDVRIMVETHHEHFDGSGYPGGLQGDSIPMFGRVAAIVDCFDAMTSPRKYAKQLSTYDALREFRNFSDKLFQKELVEQFIQAIGFFPTGTLVELSNDTVGIIVKQNNTLRLKPDVMIVLDENKEFKKNFPIVSLDNRKSLWIRKGLAPGSYGIDPGEFFLNT